MPDFLFNDVHKYVEQFAAGDTNVNETSSQFSREDLVVYLQQNVEELARVARAMSPAELAYRLPGKPEGWDTSGDEQHFDAIEIVTHVASGISFHWWGIARALKDPRPDFPKPSDGTPVTGKNRTMLGAGGWSGITIGEALAILRHTQNSFIAYVRDLPEEESRTAKSSLGLFKNLTPHSWLFLDAIHVGMHLDQLREMQTRPDYPQKVEA